MKEVEKWKSSFLSESDEELLLKVADQYEIEINNIKILQQVMVKKHPNVI